MQVLVVDNFTSYRLVKTIAGKIVSTIILDTKYWNNYLIIVKFVTSIIWLLKIVDVNEKLSICYVYEGIAKDKEFHIEYVKQLGARIRASHKCY